MTKLLLGEKTFAPFLKARGRGRPAWAPQQGLPQIRGVRADGVGGRPYHVVAAFPPPGPQFQQLVGKLGAAHSKHALCHAEH